MWTRSWGGGRQRVANWWKGAEIAGSLFLRTKTRLFTSDEQPSRVLEVEIISTGIDGVNKLLVKHRHNAMSSGDDVATESLEKDFSGIV
jgi:hypothetical protein